MSGRRVFFVNRFYWPDEPATAQLLTDLAEALAAAGHDVWVIASHPGKDSVPLEETRNGVRIRRVGGTRLGRRGLVRRAIDFATFLAGARRLVSKLAQPGDTLVAMTDPPLLGVALANIAQRRRLRLVHWVQDVFPEVTRVLGGGRVAGLLRPWRDRAWRQAAACVVLGEDMAALVKTRGVAPEKIVVSGNWAPAGLGPASLETAADLRRAWHLHDKFVVAYSGNLGRVHALEPILKVAAVLRDDPGIAFVFIGDGAQRAGLEHDARAASLSNVHFHPPQPRERLPEALAVSDVHFVTLRAGCEQLVFPSKLYGIAAIGRPVLFIGPPSAEVGRLVERHAFGFAHAADDVSGLAARIRFLRHDASARGHLTRAALDFAQTHGGLSRAVGTWRALLDGNPLAGSAGDDEKRGHPA
jgi:colanic acid biosynthesis glycosyl transferase WcaI